MRKLVALILTAWLLGSLAERAIGPSPCGMEWDNGVALDAEDCAYMGGAGW